MHVHAHTETASGIFWQSQSSVIDYDEALCFCGFGASEWWGKP